MKLEKMGLVFMNMDLKKEVVLGDNKLGYNSLQK